MKTNVLFLILFTSLLFCCKTETESKESISVAVLKGNIIDRNSEVLLLAKATDDMRQLDQVKRIPIENGKFEFKFEFSEEDVQAYQLVFEDDFLDGGWMPAIFFPENGIIDFELHSLKDYTKNKISDIGLNKDLNTYNRRIASKFNAENTAFFEKNDELGYENLTSEASKALSKKLDNAKTQEERVVIYDEMEKLREKGLDRSALGKQRDEVYEIISDNYFGDRYEYISNNKTLVSYSFLIEDLMFRDYKKIGEERVVSAFNKLKEKYPEHAYTALGYNLFRALKDLKVGGQYINFTAPDINGKLVDFESVLAKNKVVLLDLWATWCGPCIAKTRLVRPIYEKYKTKGFAILGVAGERENLDAYTKFIDKEGWPWQQLIELGMQNKIWEKYNVMNGGGGMFLVDTSGEILAVNPSAEVVENILKERL